MLVASPPVPEPTAEGGRTASRSGRVIGHKLNCVAIVLVIAA